jgi:hypothetical protein
MEHESRFNTIKPAGHSPAWPQSQTHWIGLRYGPCPPAWIAPALLRILRRPKQRVAVSRYTSSSHCNYAFCDNQQPGRGILVPELLSLLTAYSLPPVMDWCDRFFACWSGKVRCGVWPGFYTGFQLQARGATHIHPGCTPRMQATQIFSFATCMDVTP